MRVCVCLHACDGCFLFFLFAFFVRPSLRTVYYRYSAHASKHAENGLERADSDAPRHSACRLVRWLDRRTDGAALTDGQRKRFGRAVDACVQDQISIDGAQMWCRIFSECRAPCCAAFCRMSLAASFPSLPFAGCASPPLCRSHSMHTPVASSVLT